MCVCLCVCVCVCVCYQSCYHIHSGLSDWVSCLFVCFIPSQGQRLTVCMTAVQDNVHCGGEKGICDLVFITKDIHTLNASVFLSL